MLVTALFDLNTRCGPDSGFRTAEQYLSMFRWVLRMEMPTILFVDTPLKEECLKLIPKRDNLYTLPISVEELPSWRDMERYPNLEAANSKVSTYPEYAAVVTSKVYLLFRARQHIMEELPEHNQVTLAWVDIGSAHFGSKKSLDYASELQEQIRKSTETDKITAVLIFPTYKQDYQDLKEYLSIYWARIAGGLIICPWKQVTWLTETLRDYNNRILRECSMRALEEQLLSMITTEHPYRFRYVYGGYYVHTLNMRWITSSLDMVISSLTKFRYLSNMFSRKESNSYSELGAELLNLLLDSLKYSGVQYTSEQVSIILMDGLRIVEQRDISLAKRLALLICYLRHEKSNIRSSVLAEKDLPSIMSSLGIDIDSHPGHEVMETDDAEWIWSVL